METKLVKLTETESKMVVIRSWEGVGKEKLLLTRYIVSVLQNAKVLVICFRQGEYTKNSSAQLLSHVQLFVTSRTAALQASLSITNSRSLELPELIQTHVHRVGDVIQPSHSLSSSYPPAFDLSQHQGLFQ